MAHAVEDSCEPERKHKGVEDLTKAQELCCLVFGGGVTGLCGSLVLILLMTTMWYHNDKRRGRPVRNPGKGKGNVGGTRRRWPSRSQAKRSDEQSFLLDLLSHLLLRLLANRTKESLIV